MATTAVAPNAAVEVETAASDNQDFGEPVKSVNIEHVRFQLVEPKRKETKDEQGNVTETEVDYDVKVYTDPSEKLRKELISKGYEVKLSQVCIKQIAGNPDGFGLIISNPRENVGIWNRGYSQKYGFVTSKKFSEDKPNEPGVPAWTATEEPYDLSAEMNEETARRNLTPDERLRKDLRDSGADDEMIAVMFAAKLALAAKRAEAARTTSTEVATVA